MISSYVIGSLFESAETILAGTVVSFLNAMRDARYVSTCD